jgi:TPR repeat protein
MIRQFLQAISVVRHNPVMKQIPDYILAIAKDQFEDAVPLLRTAVARDDANAMAVLGSVLLTGRGGVPRDPEEGAAWLRQAAVRGHLDAQALFAACLASGIGVAVNEQEAALWAFRAAKGGKSSATRLLHTLCFKNRALVGPHFTQEEVDDLVRLSHRPASQLLH